MTTTATKAKAPKRQNGSEIVKALEVLFNAIRKRHPELPDVVIITGSGLTSGAWAHFWRDRWADRDDETSKRPEMFVSGERLACGAELTLQSMLHECAHALAFINDEQDTSRQNRYHNKTFVKWAETMGLEYVQDSPDSTTGYSAVTLTEAAKVNYKVEIEKLDTAIKTFLHNPWSTGTGTGGGDNTHRMPKAKRTTTTPSRNNVKYVCDCEKPRVMRMAPSVFEIASTTCGDCGQDFHESA